MKKHLMIGLLALAWFNGKAFAFEAGYNEYGYVPGYRAGTSHNRATRNLYQRQFRQAYRSTTLFAEPSRQVAESGTRYASAGFTPVRDWQNNARPGAWCGWYMRQVLNVADPSYNWAPHWMTYGHATGPEVGAVVVWPWHVGRIVGRSNNGQWLVENGNYNNRVAVVPMSLAGAIGFRKG